MTDTPVPEVPPPPAPISAPAKRGRPAWQTWGAVVLATAVGVVGAAVVADNASADGEEPVAPSRTVRPVPVLGSELGSSLSSAVSEYAVTAFSDPTRGLVLSAWGAAFSELFGPAGEGVPPDIPGALVDDPRLSDEPADPSFEDVCADDPEADGCPGDGAQGATVDGEAPLGPNRAMVYAFPAADAQLADECAFADVLDSELPIAVITTNPGLIEVTVGTDVVEVESDDAEVEEFEAWRESGEEARPPASFVAHCLALPRPSSSVPVEISVVALDEADQVARATTTLLPAPTGQLPPSITPIDDTMVRVDVPLPPGDLDATVRAVPLLDPSTAAGCDALPPPGPATGWRIGATVLTSDAPAPGERPYLEAFPRTRRVTVPLPEGEPSLLCVTSTGPLGTTSVVATPPDARRLELAVTEVDAEGALADGAVKVRGTFAELGWTPCGVALPALEAGTSAPGLAGRMCGSGGDTGAIAAAGGVLDLTVQTADTATHRVRIPLSAVPGGTPVEAYRVPIPAPDLDGVLCTEGAEQEGCIEPEGDAVLGTLVVSATWTEGPTGPASWTIAAVPVAEEASPPPAED